MTRTDNFIQHLLFKHIRQFTKFDYNLSNKASLTKFQRTKATQSILSKLLFLIMKAKINNEIIRNFLHARKFKNRLLNNLWVKRRTDKGS